MHIPIDIVRSAVMALALGLGLSATSAGATCLSPDESRQVLAAGQVMPLSDAIRLAGVRGQPVGQARLCENRGGWFYRVKVLDRRGDVTRVDIPAN